MTKATRQTDYRQKRLKKAATAWYAVAAVGQLAFIGFIFVYYAKRTLHGDFASWNDKPLIDGYIAGDAGGNIMFIAHVLLAAVVTLGGLAQLVPAFRRRAPGFHRWNGRVFILIACFLGLGGLWLVWVRGTLLSHISGLAVSLNGVLIVVFACAAWRYAWKKQFAAHRRFALRTFVVVSGVWFLRIGIMAWVLINQQPRGMNESMSGPADIALTFGSYLIPLAILELYFMAQRTDRPDHVWLALVALSLGTVITAIGVFGTIGLMWWPYL